MHILTSWISLDNFKTGLFLCQQCTDNDWKILQ